MIVKKDLLNWVYARKHRNDHKYDIFSENIEIRIEYKDKKKLILDIVNY